MTIRWTRDAIATLRAETQVAAAPILALLDPKDVLDNLVKQVASLESASTPDDMMRCFFWILIALKHQADQGGLSDFQVGKLFALAKDLLKVQGIQPGTSRLAHVHANLHDLHSQIYRRRGEHWSAAWEQLLADFNLSSRAEKSEMTAFQHLCHGHRALRLAYAQVADQHFSACLQASEKYAPRANLGKARIRWLTGTLDLHVTPAATNDPAVELELRWMQLTARTLSSGNFAILVPKLRRGSEFYSQGFVLEGMLWLMCAPDPKLVNAVAKMDNLARNKSIEIDRTSALSRCVRQLERCHDTVLPFPVRLEQLGMMLGQLHELLTVEHELLVLAAATRWLRRSHAIAFAEITHARYRNIALSLTGGATGDPWRLLEEGAAAQTEPTLAHRVS